MSFVLIEMYTLKVTIYIYVGYIIIFSVGSGYVADGAERVEGKNGRFVSLSLSLCRKQVID